MKQSGFSKGHIPWNKGKHIVNAGTFKVGHKLPKESIDKMKKSLKGKKSWNIGTKGIMKSNRTSFEKGSIPWNKGLCGKDNPLWIKDRSIAKRREERNDPAYQLWSRDVKRRDGWKCKMCDCKKRLQAHHILPWRDFPELRYDINNGITLCRVHHPRKREDEQRLIPFFKEMVEVKEII